SSPTPPGHFWIRERFKISNRSNPYWPYAFGTSDYSTLTDWPGGGVVGIHGDFGQPQLVPGASSYGCVRIHDRYLYWLGANVPCIEPVAATPALEMVDLAGRLFRWLVVAPDHVSIRAGVDRVVAVVAEQLVVTDIRGHTVGVRVPVGAARPSACCSTAA